MSSNKPPTTVSTSKDIDQFLEQVNNSPVVANNSPGRIIFALDATASRQAAWDQACQLQGDMFTKTEALGGLSIQLCFYRGYREFRVSPWHRDSAAVLKAMLTIQCLGGHTQIERLLKHAIKEHQETPINALIFIGDALEESIDALCNLAGQMGLISLPIFIFQEGHDSVASRGFQQLAKLSRGAHCQFDINSPHELNQLLNAVAVFATGGRSALQKLAQESDTVRKLVHQIDP